MKTRSKLTRRTFVGATLVGAGAAAGALIRKAQEPGADGKAPGTVTDAAMAYDVSEFEKTDPRHLLFHPDGFFEADFEHVKRLATAPGGLVLVAGDRQVKLFNAAGRVQSEITLSRPAHCLHVSGPDELFVGLGNFFEVYDFSGKQKLRSPRLGDDSFLTSLAVHRQTVYVADAGRREVLLCDRESGEITGRFGRKDEPPGCPGFVVPSPYFDLSVGRDDRLRIANPGRLRVETYTLDGHFESSWGQAGMGIDRFCGCCNPVYLALTGDGDVITSEKGLARVNVYSASGAFKGAVAGPETLVKDKELAKRACGDCRQGAGFDVALDEKGRVLVLDPFQMIVRAFAPGAQA
jgi:hypothetical protein